MFKRNWHWVLAVLLIAFGIIGFVFLGSKAQVGPVTVYKAVTPAPKLTLEDTSRTDSLSDVRMQPLNETVAVPSEPGIVETHPMDETETQEVSLTEKNGTSDATDAAESEKLYFGDYTMEELVQIRDWGKDLEARLMEKYPEFAELTRMTPEEIAQKYPTDEDRIQLAMRGQEFFNVYLEETRSFLVTLPGPLRELVIAKVHLQLAENWGRERADQAMIRFTDLVK